MQQNDTLETLIQRADRALYTSKEKGGNTITLK
jgi:GGDEF domain-containing protein